MKRSVVLLFLIAIMMNGAGLKAADDRVRLCITTSTDNSGMDHSLWSAIVVRSPLFDREVTGHAAEGDQSNRVSN